MNRDCVPSEFPTGQTFILGVGTQGGGGAGNSIKSELQLEPSMYSSGRLICQLHVQNLTVRKNKYKLPQQVYFGQATKINSIHEKHWFPVSVLRPAQTSEI